MAGAVPPVVVPLASEDWEVLVGAMSVQPRLSTGIGDEVMERNAFGFELVLVPRRAGPLGLPQFQVVVGDATARSPSTTLTIRPTPSAGRPASFLGGVGPIEVEAELDPSAVRIGQSSRLEIRIRGPGAFGSTIRPGQPIPDSPSLKIRMHDSETIWSPATPERAWFYELRPLETGSFRVPPVLISTFDPKIGQYTTVATAPLTLRSTQPGGPQHVSLETPPVPLSSDARTRRAALAAAVVLALACAGLGLPWLVRRRRGSAAPRHARKVAHQLARTADEQLGQVIQAGLQRYLLETVRWSGGALTPDEVALAVDDQHLSPRAADLVRMLDRELYSTKSDAGALRASAIVLFSELSRLRG
jgi:hypothetical protein